LRACRDYLIQLRWPEGFRCPHCGGRENSCLKNARFERGYGAFRDGVRPAHVGDQYRIQTANYRHRQDRVPVFPTDVYVA
jgi:hypothetical protein